jgi:hypothetical protein
LNKNEENAQYKNGARPTKKFEALFAKMPNIMDIKDPQKFKSRMDKFQTGIDKLTTQARKEWCKENKFTKKTCLAKWKKHMKKFKLL